MDVAEVRDEVAALGRDGFLKRYGRFYLVLTDPGKLDQFADFVNTATRDANEIAGGKRMEAVDIRAIVSAQGGDARVTLGREESDLNIRHPKVSKHHATFTVSGGLLSLEDAGSKNGTWVNGTPLARGERVPVDVGDTVNFGSVAATVWGLDDLLAACGK